MIEMPLNQLPATVDRQTIELKFDAAKGKLTIDAAQLGGLVSYNLDRLHELDEVGWWDSNASSPPAVTAGSIMTSATSTIGSSSKAYKAGRNEADRAGALRKRAYLRRAGRRGEKEGRVTAHDYVALGRSSPKWKPFAAFCIWRKSPVAACMCVMSAARKG